MPGIWPLKLISALWSRRVFVTGSYFTVPLTPSITLRSLQLSRVTGVPAISIPHVKGWITTLSVTLVPFRATHFSELLKAAPVGDKMAVSRSVRLAMSQMEPPLPCAVTAALCIVRVSFVAPDWPAMPQLPMAFTVQSLMVRADLTTYIPQLSVLVVLSVPSPLIVVGFRRKIAARELLMLLVPKTSIVKSGVAL